MYLTWEATQKDLKEGAAQLDLVRQAAQKTEQQAVKQAMQRAVQLVHQPEIFVSEVGRGNLDSAQVESAKKFLKSRSKNQQLLFREWE